MSMYDHTAAHYQHEVHVYVEHAHHDARVFHQLDVHDTRFDQRRDDQLPWRNPRTGRCYTQGHELTFWETLVQWWRRP